LEKLKKAIDSLSLLLRKREELDGEENR